jgi:hypothetical protein
MGTTLAGMSELTALDLDVLEVCQEVIQRQHELLPLLAQVLGVPPEEVWYTWALRRCRQSGVIAGTDWSYFFHGHECDVKNKKDGRFLRYDFGPGGRVDTITAWGILQFIMTTTSPWSELAELKATFAKGPPPFDQYSGDFHRMGTVWDHFRASGVLERANPELIAFEQQYTTTLPGGSRFIKFPAGTPERTQVDCSVAHRERISAVGYELLRQRQAHAEV